MNDEIDQDSIEEDSVEGGNFASDTFDKSAKKAQGNFKTQRAQKNVIIRGSSKKGERNVSRNSKNNQKSASKKQRYDDFSDKKELTSSASATKLGIFYSTSS